jgi:hypothetical protein
MCKTSRYKNWETMHDKNFILISLLVSYLYSYSYIYFYLLYLHLHLLVLLTNLQGEKLQIAVTNLKPQFFFTINMKFHVSTEKGAHFLYVEDFWLKKFPKNANFTLFLQDKSI